MRLQKLFRRLVLDDMNPWKGVSGLRVLVVNQADLLNKGDQALLTATCNLVRQSLPGSNIRVVSHTADVDAPRSLWPVLPTYEIHAGTRKQRWKAKLVLGLLSLLYRATSHYPTLRWLWDAVSKFMPATLRAYADCDLVISRGGDNWTEDYGMPWLYLDAVEAALRFNKRTILLGESVGPFNDPEIKCVVLKVLQLLHAVVVRDILAYNYLVSIGLGRTSLTMLPDVAFTLSPADETALSAMIQTESLHLRTPIVAFSISALISRYGFPGCFSQRRHIEYVRAMASVADHCIEAYGVEVVFIAHVVGVGNDDRVVSGEVRDLMKHPDKAHCIQGEYSHETYRAFLGHYAEMAVASRMHAAIAAATVGVPVVPISYSNKTQGIFGHTLGQRDLVVDIRECDVGDDLVMSLVQKIDDCWRRRSSIRAQLVQRSALLAKRAEAYVDVIRDAVCKT